MVVMGEKYNVGDESAQPNTGSYAHPSYCEAVEIHEITS